MDTPHLAWYLSGGTTELLLVTPGNKNVNAEKIGGTQDISAGQLIDRTGNTFGLRFPSGKEIDRLSRESDCKERFKVKLNGLTFSFSGLENKMPCVLCGNGQPCRHGKICAQLRLLMYRLGHARGAEAVSRFSGGLLRRRCVQRTAAAVLPGF